MFIVHCLSWFYLCNFNYTLFLICLLLGFFCFWEFIRSTDFWFLWWITTVMIIFGLAMVELLFIIWYIFVFFFFLIFVEENWVPFLDVMWFLMGRFFCDCEFLFLWFWLERLLSVGIIFLFLPFCCYLSYHYIVYVEESVCFLFRYFKSILIPPFLNFGLGYQPDWIQAGIYVVH